MDRLLEYCAHHPYLAALAGLAAVAVLAYEAWLRAQNAGALAPQEVIRLMNQGATVLDLRAAGFHQGIQSARWPGCLACREPAAGTRMSWPWTYRASSSIELPGAPTATRLTRCSSPRACLSRRSTSKRTPNNVRK